MKKLFFLITIFSLCSYLGLFLPTIAYAATKPAKPPAAKGASGAGGGGSSSSDWKQDSTADEFDKAYDGEVNKAAYDWRSAIGNMATLKCLINPDYPTDDMTQEEIDALVCTKDKEKAPSLTKNSAVTKLASYIGTIYANPPANTAIFLRDTGESLGFLPKRANAQGIGFSGLTSLYEIWKTFRNLAYGILAVIMIVIGFMVMFRKHIDPKTVVTVQNALPNVVVALLLVSFSYMIVGVMIDLMYYSFMAIVALMVNASGGRLGQDTLRVYLTGGFSSTAGALFWGGLSSYDDILQMLNPWPDAMSSSSVWQNIGNIIQATISTGAFFAGAPVILGLILAIALIIGIVRVFFMLVSAYISIIMSLLVAPFQLLMTALPGSTAFADWIKNLISNLMVFPITAAMLLIGTYLTRYESVFGKGSIWTPPLISEGGGQRGMAGVIGLGILLSIPTIVNSLKESLKAASPMPNTIGAIAGPIGSGVGSVWNLGYQASYIKSAFRGTHPTNDVGAATDATTKGPNAAIPSGQVHGKGG